MSMSTTFRSGVQRTGKQAVSPLGQHDEFAGGLIAFHVLVGSDDVVQTEDTIDVGPVDAGFDLVDDSLQHGCDQARVQPSTRRGCLPSTYPTNGG